MARRAAWPPPRRRPTRSSTTLPADVEVGLVTFADTAAHRRSRRPPTAPPSGPRSTACELNDVVGTALFDGAAAGGRPDRRHRGAQRRSCSPTATRTAAAPRPSTTPSRRQPPTTSRRRCLHRRRPTSTPQELTRPGDRSRRAGHHAATRTTLASDLPGRRRGDPQPAAGHGRPARRHLRRSATSRSPRRRATSSVDRHRVPLAVRRRGRRVAPNSRAGAGPGRRPGCPSISTDALPRHPRRRCSSACVALLFVALSTIKRDEKQGRVRRRLSLYTLTGRPAAKKEQSTTALGSSQIARVGGRARRPGRPAARLRDGPRAAAGRRRACRCGPPSGCSSTSASAVGLSVLLLLLTGGSPLIAVLGLGLGHRPALGLPDRQGVPPHVGLPRAAARHAAAGRRQPVGRLLHSRRRWTPSSARASSPITGEFNRALVEARLGVPIEDALDGIAERMNSKDFAWVVMAIRIQREVGGNLAELLTTVAGDAARARAAAPPGVRCCPPRAGCRPGSSGCCRSCSPSTSLLVRPEYLQPLVHGPDRLAAARLSARSLLAVGVALDAQGRQGGGLTWTPT